MKINSIIKNAFKTLAAASLLFLYACEYETLPTYSGIDNVYFRFAYDGSLVDSTTVMFGYDLKPKTDSIVLIGVKAMGAVTDYNRPVSFELDESKSTAKLGRDVLLVPQVSMIRAGSTTGYVCIVVFNNEMLSDGNSLVAALRIVENEYFKADYVRNRSRFTGRNSNMVATEYRVRFNNTNERPNMWTPAARENDFNNAFGPYSREKFRLMCEILPGCSWEYFTYGPDESPSTVFTRNFPMALVTGWARTLHFYLQYYKEVHGEPLLDENGKEITSGAAFVV
jgi:hypothetical protein